VLEPSDYLGPEIPGRELVILGDTANSQEILGWFLAGNRIPNIGCSVADPHHVDAHPDQTFHFDENPVPDPDRCKTASLPNFC
jgi:hypothetical protein